MKRVWTAVFTLHSGHVENVSRARYSQSPIMQFLQGLITMIGKCMYSPWISVTDCTFSDVYGNYMQLERFFSFVPFTKIQLQILNTSAKFWHLFRYIVHIYARKTPYIKSLANVHFILSEKSATESLFLHIRFGLAGSLLFLIAKSLWTVLTRL